MVKKKKRKKKITRKDLNIIELLPELGKLKKEFKKYNQSELIAILGGLQVYPKNHSNTLRLQTASLIACSAKKSGEKKINPDQLRKILNKCLSPHSYIGKMEDPLENPFTENIEFYGGNYIIYPGTIDGGSFVLRMLLRSIFYNEKEFPRDFVAIVRATSLFLLTLSNEVASRLGHIRFMNSPDRWKEYIEIPDSSQLSELSKAVTFTKKEIDILLGRFGLDSNFLLPFITQIGDHRLLRGGLLEENPLLVKPLVDAGDKIILAVPCSIVDALRHFIWVISQEFGICALLARRFRETLWVNVQKCLRYMFFSDVDLEILPWEEDLPVEEGIFKIDTDKLAYVQLIADDARDYSKDEPYGIWEVNDLYRKICDRQETISKWLTSGDQSSCHEVLLIVVLGGIGRRFFFGLDKPPINTRILPTTVDDLEVVAQLKNSDSLTLWKYAGAETRLRDSASVSVHSFLDIYAPYLGHHHSFCLSDEKQPNYVRVLPGSGRSLRVKAAQMCDIHAALRGNPPYYVAVCRRYEDEPIPIYFIEGAIGEPPNFLVEEYSQPIWVGPQEEVEQIPAELVEIYFETTDMFAYWLWQLTPNLRPHLESLGSSPIHIAFNFENNQSWANLREKSIGKNELPPKFESEIYGRIIVLTIPDTIQPYLQRADNRGERLILDALMQSLDDMLDKYGLHHCIDEEERRRILDTHAPLGPKKKFFSINIERNVSLSPHFLPQLRLVQEHDIEEQLDGLVEALGKEVPQVGYVVDKEEQSKLFREIVDVYLHRLKAILPKFAWQPLLEQLIGYNEAICHQREFRKLTTSTTIECFTELQSYVQERAEELPEIESTSLAVRTLIEIVSAEPPRGYKEISVDELDKLLAITYHIVNWATLSDHIHLGILNHKLSILPSGRVGIERERTENIWDPFVEIKTLEDVELAMGSFKSRFEIEEKSKPDLQDAEYESVLKAEFGLTLTQIMEFYEFLIRIGFEQKTVSPHLHLSELKRRLVDTLKWPDAQIEKAINLFSLFPRRKWEEAPEGFDAREDIWPWRYNRQLSYMRRPLVVGPEPKDNPVVFWGPRHVENASKYLISLVFDGRYKICKNTSKEMRTFIGKIQDKAGKEFTDEVRRWFEENTDLQVYSRVPMNPGEALNSEVDLGDIDVLAIDRINKKIYSFECKNMNFGRNPREMANEIERLMGKDEADDSLINKHLKRDEWLKNNISILSSVYDLQTKFLEICSFILTAEEIPATYVRDMSLSFISFTCLKREGIGILNDP